jgi:hypothetical protein
MLQAFYRNQNFHTFATEVVEGSRLEPQEFGSHPHITAYFSAFHLDIILPSRPRFLKVVSLFLPNFLPKFTPVNFIILIQYTKGFRCCSSSWCNFLHLQPFIWKQNIFFFILSSNTLSLFSSSGVHCFIILLGKSLTFRTSNSKVRCGNFVIKATESFLPNKMARGE